MKRCSSCDMEKLDTEFYVRHSQCIPCHANTTREWFKKHPGKYAQYCKKWKETNREYMKQYNKIRYERLKNERS